MEASRFRAGASPIVVSIPHAGTFVPDPVAERMTGAGRALPDTDWHLDRLYQFLANSEVTIITATHSRYVIDLNRAVDNAPLYPARWGSALCPTLSFAGEPIYRPDTAPDAAEIQRRVERYWQPYHQRLQRVLEDLRSRYGFVILWDAHSIRSKVPRLFQGILPDLNLGTDGGRSCDPRLAGQLLDCARRAANFSVVLNGRFQGGSITRSYGKPASGGHAVHVELAQATYMNETPPFSFHAEKAAAICSALRQLLGVAARFKP
jgi:N-formylglutamate deformylase